MKYLVMVIISFFSLSCKDAERASQDSTTSNFRVDFDSDFEIYDPIAKLAGRCIMEKFTIESLAKAVAKNVEEGGYNIPTTQEVLEEVNKTPLCIDYCQGLVQTLNESPNSSVVEKWGILEICASVGVILPEDRIKWDTEVTLKRKIPVEF